MHSMTSSHNLQLIEHVWPARREWKTSRSFKV